jgi:hypothetical protein
MTRPLKRNDQVQSSIALWSQLPEMTRHRLAVLVSQALVQKEISGPARDQNNAEHGAER